jgi:hypothetical protein
VSTCPGCGLELPGEAPADPCRHASAECWALYGEVSGAQMTRPARLGAVRQLTVDAYAAQHVGPETPPIGPAFALIGLHLALDEGWAGWQVRDEHQRLARRRREWPRLTPPADLGPLTVFDVAMADSDDEHVALVRRWAETVWKAWRLSLPPPGLPYP